MAILFDLDGTLLDTSHDIHLAVNKILSEEKYPNVDYAAVRSNISFGSKHILAHALNFDILTNPEHAKYIDSIYPRFLDHYAQTNFSQTSAFAGINTLLEQIEQNNQRWGIVTNKNRALTEPILHLAGYTSRAACVVCGDTTKSCKPSPEPLLHACELLKINPTECVYVGDSATDIEAGKAAGMRTIAVSFGFIPENACIAAWEADYIAEHPQQIFHQIKQWLGKTND